MADVVKRRYDSSGRRARAREGRLQVIQAAHQLFVAEGYGRTTIADVARAAGVAPETIYAAFGSKRALLHRVWDVTVGGDDAEILVHERPEFLAIRQLDDLETRLRLHARAHTAIARRLAPLFIALQGAAASEPEAAEMVATIDDQRLRAMTVHAREAAATGQLACSEGECRDVLWSTTDGIIWHRLVQQRGWTDDRYAHWLGDLWVATLVER